MEKHHWVTVFCDILGWIYFFAWSISFYPQTIVNFKRKCVIGMSFDYMGIYNFTGFLAYSVYTIATFIHNNGTSNKDNPIAINDIAFATHALLLTAICCIQIIFYDRGTQKPSLFAVGLGSACWILAIYNVILSFLGDPTIGILDQTIPWFGEFSTISFFGYIKVAVTTVKYVPQVYMNWRDKSTTGWSIHNVLLDCTGGSLSLLQQFLSAYNTDDWSFVTGNIPKFILGFESICFDTIFMCQHYVLYGDNDSPLRKSKAQLLAQEKDQISYKKLNESDIIGKDYSTNIKSASDNNINNNNDVKVYE
eukprot:148890_1